MADCKLVNASVVTAISNIGGSESGHLMGIAKRYETAGIVLMEALNAAIADMEGETKTALKRFFDADIKNYVVDDLPAAINGLSVLLEANRVNFVDVDKRIAESISASNP